MVPDNGAVFEIHNAAAVGSADFVADGIAQLAAFGSQAQPHVADGPLDGVSAGLRGVIDCAVLVEAKTAPAVGRGLLFAGRLTERVLGSAGISLVDGSG